MRVRRYLRRLFPARDDRGALLIIAMAIVTVVAVVTGFVLTRGDGSLRATVALRDVARTSYAADAGAQVAINALRTGYNVGSGEPAGWYYTNVKNTGCFGYDGPLATATAKDTLVLNNLIPQAGGETQQPMSARVVCTPDNDTGDQGSAVPITNANKPGYAVVTLGGAVDATGSKSPGLLVRGGIYSNGAVKGPVNVLAGGVRAVGSCDATVTASPKSCNSGPPISDPNYASELGGTIPGLRTPPTTCSGGVAIFEPGYYDNASTLNTATNLCSVAWFKPGTYYFDFHNDSCANVCPSNVYGTGGNTWTINGATVIGGTPVDANNNTLSQPPSNVSVPGACRSPITDVNAQGVQFVFGGSSRIYVDQNSKMELCATYHADRPPIELYGLKSGTTPTATNANGLVASSVPSAGAFTRSTTTGAATEADLAAPNDGNAATWKTTSAAAQSTTLTAQGFAPGSAVPPGSILTAATLHVRHQDADGTASSQATAKVTVGGTTTTAVNVPVSATATTSDLAITGTNLNSLQKEIHDNGYAGASIAYTANAKKNAATTTVDMVKLDLTYYVPVLRGQGGTCIDGTGGGCRFIDMKNGNNKVQVYFQGTTYVPYGDLQLLLGNFASEIMKFGLVARQLEFQFWNGASDQTYPVIEIPDNTPGFGVETTLVRLEVYVCPGTTCATGGELALKSKVKIFDDGGTPGPPHRQMTVLSWSHNR
ncbi:hypothetical protein GUY44_16695 [Pimelobacter simplex]|nr:hypothetical protein [Pimelobacter simplex]MCG8152129.1 hypothetical protein [Pimelobacter simplex]GEB12879.1 hypothetical protein NSI01_11940 [Pimelobacter simplex]SFM52876.1 hypothetical protein SAMN05421671_2150 [Pimelobacter simplex]